MDLFNNDEYFTAIGNQKINRIKGNIKKMLSGDIEELLLSLNAGDLEFAKDIALNLKRHLELKTKPTPNNESLKDMRNT